MTSERWQQIEQAFHRVRAAQPGERAALLDSGCGGDPELKREVEQLLDAEDAAGSFLSSDRLPSASTETQGLPAGRKIGQYEVLSSIGEGAMGEVYLALDTRLGRRVAIKVLPARFAGDPERVTRFMREAKVSSALNHPNIVTVYDGGEDNGARFIATEFIEGVTIRQRLATGPLDLAEALDIATQCAVALSAAHEAGVAHRDVKPENIMLRPDGVVKIVDFGLASVALPDPGFTATQAGAIIGTPRYMSPEQARGERSDAASDIFSLGAVFYEMVTGRPAFAGKSSSEVLAALLTAEPDRTGVPVGLHPVFAKALAKPLDARYRSMREFAADLTALKQKQQLLTIRPRPRAHMLVQMALPAAFLVAGLVWYSRPAIKDSQAHSLPSVVPLTSFAGYKQYPAISPDGKRLAFSWNGGEGGIGGKRKRNIYVKEIGTGEPVQLTHSEEDNVWPAWSPDGREIAFGRLYGPNEFTFYVIPANGGTERKLAQGRQGVAWMPDGKRLALSRPPSINGPRGLFLLDVHTGEQRNLTDPKGEYDTQPAVSPDRRWIAFTRGTVEHQRGLWVMPIEGGPARDLNIGDRRIHGLAWTADGREVIFSAILERASATLWRVPIDGGSVRHVDLVPDDAYAPNVSKAGGSLAFTMWGLDTNIYQLTRAGIDHAFKPQPLGPKLLRIVSSREDHSPTFSPDGKWVAFVSTRSGAPEIWREPAEGGTPSRLTDMKATSLGTPRWSPDSRSIAFDCRTSRNPAVYVVGLDGGGLRKVNTEGGDEFMPAWSPDGRWLYFTSERSGNLQLWKMPADGGTAVQLTHSGGFESWPSTDGKLIYYTKARGETGIWYVPAEGGAEKPLPELNTYNRITRSWGLVRDGIYFLSRQDGPRQDVRFFHFATRKISLVATLDKEPPIDVSAVALSPSGRDLRIVHIDHEVNDLMVLENFR
jgi:serine/threonine protein kinase/Tol biopolymer transport system component